MTAITPIDTGRPWHDIAGDMKNALTKAAFEALLAEALSKPNIRQHDGMAYEANVYGHAFSCMGCTDMGRELVKAARRWNDPAWRNLAVDCFVTALTRWSAGGLLSDSGDWLHGRTSETDPTKGGTLNKAMIAMYNMVLASSDFDALSQPVLARVLHAQARASVAQLANPAAWPNWLSFIPRKGNGSPIKRSWLAYGVNWDNRSPYFLDNDPTKNGHYALKCGEMLAALHTRLSFSIVPFQNMMVTDNKNVLQWFRLMTDLKAIDGWYVDSNCPAKGDFTRLTITHDPVPLEPWLDIWLTKVGAP